MPIIKATDALPERPVIVTVFGVPGSGKTSLFNTSDNPLLIDFDRGADRSVLRGDVLKVNRWEDVLEEESKGTFKDYKTIGIDTPKACLDDFLMDYAVRSDIKNSRNKLAAYGFIGDAFKLFAANRRAEEADIVLIAHDKTEKEGDAIRIFPDVTGQSYNLIMRISDQVGYISIRNNKRTISFDPTDSTVGKNVARLPVLQIPDCEDPSFRSFMAEIIKSTKASIASLTEEQEKSIQVSLQWKEAILAEKDPNILTSFVTQIMEIPDVPLRKALLRTLNNHASGIGLQWDKETRSYDLSKDVSAS